MKVAVLGVGAIGGLVLGYLKERGVDVCAVARPYQIGPLSKDGLYIEGVRGSKVIREFAVSGKLCHDVDLAVVAVKSQNLEEVINDNKSHLKNSYVVSTQNGIAADYILGKHFDKEKIISGIVMFGATFFAPNKVVHNFEGKLILGSVFDKPVDKSGLVRQIFSSAFDVEFTPNIKGKKYLKLFVNLNNCIPACLGMSMQESFSDLEICRVAIKLIKETFAVIKQAGVVLEDLPTYPVQRVGGLAGMDEAQAAGIYSKVMTGLSLEPLYGSILQSIKRGKKSEIDYINGEVIRLAKENDICASVNEVVVKMVHEVEDTGRFFSKSEFLKKIK